MFNKIIFAPVTILGISGLVVMSGAAMLEGIVSPSAHALEATQPLTLAPLPSDRLIARPPSSESQCSPRKAKDSSSQASRCRSSS
jgi:hypothetical protein